MFGGKMGFMSAVKQRLAAATERYKGLLGQKDAQLRSANAEIDSLRQQLAANDEKARKMEEGLERRKRQLSALKQRLDACKEFSECLELHNRLKAEVLELRQNSVVLENKASDALRQLARKTELLDMLQKASSDGKIDLKKIETQFLLLKKENAAFRAKFAQQEGLIQSLKQEEEKLKNKMKQLWREAGASGVTGPGSASGSS